MTVYDNLENYEIPDGFNLSIEQEDELARIVAEIIPELDKRKTSRVETRKYFKRALCFSTHVLQSNAAKGKKFDLYEEGEEYKSLEGEYRWPSDLLQPVLLDVLEVERIKYGYIINLLQDDIHSRGKVRLKNDWHVSDGLVLFGNAFDINEIKKESEGNPDIRSRIMFLRETKAKFERSEFLSFDESQEWGNSFSLAIDDLISLEEKRLELYSSGFETPPIVQSPSTTSNNITKYYIRVNDYCTEHYINSDTVYSQFICALDIDKEFVSKESMLELFDLVDKEFSSFLETTEILDIYKIDEVFTFLDIWYDLFKDAVDSAYSESQYIIKQTVKKQETVVSQEALNRKALIHAHFVVQKASVVVSGLKANILYNHRYLSEVFYNINGGPVEIFLQERERLVHKFGGGNERDILFDLGANIDAFYNVILDIVKDGLIEIAIESEGTDDEYRLEEYRFRMRQLILQGIQFYMGLVKTHPEVSSTTYHEAVSWVETTRYCIMSTVLTACQWVASVPERYAIFDLALFQNVSFEYIPQLLEHALKEYKSDTGNIEIDGQLNSLGERDVDEMSAVVPILPADAIGNDFITQADIDKAIEQKKEEDARIREIHLPFPAPLDEEVNEADLRSDSTSGDTDDTTHILLAGKEDEVRGYINAHIDRKTPTKAICLLLAAKDLGIIGKLTFGEAKALFGKFAGRSTFNQYYNGYRAVDPAVVAAYKTALEQQFKSPPSSSE